MSPPHGSRTHYGEIPSDDKAICIPSHEALVASHKNSGVHLGFVATQNRLGLRRPPVCGHFVQSIHKVTGLALVGARNSSLMLWFQ